MWTMCSEKVNKSQLNPINFCEPLIFAKQNCKKISSTLGPFSCILGQLKKFYSRGFGFKLLKRNILDTSSFGYSQLWSWILTTLADFSPKISMNIYYSFRPILTDDS